MAVRSLLWTRKRMCLTAVIIVNGKRQTDVSSEACCNGGQMAIWSRITDPDGDVHSDALPDDARALVVPEADDSRCGLTDQKVWNLGLLMSCDGPAGWAT
jgi:hypothetical protein